jgi:hypothetical protein
MQRSLPRVDVDPYADREHRLLSSTHAPATQNSLALQSPSSLQMQNPVPVLQLPEKHCAFAEHRHWPPLHTPEAQWLPAVQPHARVAAEQVPERHWSRPFTFGALEVHPQVPPMQAPLHCESAVQMHWPLVVLHVPDGQSLLPLQRHWPVPVSHTPDVQSAPLVHKQVPVAVEHVVAPAHPVVLVHAQRPVASSQIVPAGHCASAVHRHFPSASEQNAPAAHCAVEVQTNAGCMRAAVFPA